MSTNDNVNSAGRSPRNYQKASNNNEDQNNFRVHLPEGPNTHNAREFVQRSQNNEASLSARRPSKLNNSNANESENKNHDTEKTQMPHPFKPLRKSTRHRSKRRIHKPPQPPNPPHPLPNLPYQSQSTNQSQSHLPQYQQPQTSKVNQQQNQPSQFQSTNQTQSQSHLPQFQSQNRFTQNPSQSTSNQQHQQQQPQVQLPRFRFTRNNSTSIQTPQSSTFSEPKQNLKAINWPHHTSRLPQNYIPTFYDLFLNFTKEPNQIEASVTISFQKKEKNEFVFLNLDRTITITSIIQNGNELKYAINFPFLLIHQSNQQGVEISTHPITINYIVQPYNTMKRSQNDEDEKGMFTCDGAYMTHFEPNNARKLLPCFDEPSPKAIFKVRLRISSKLVGLSNMPIENVKENGNQKDLVFKKTPPMCAYLLCICVGPFTSIQGMTQNGLPIKIYAVNSSKQIFKDLLKIAIFTVDWFGRKLKASFDLPHLQIVSHKGFVHYAMENYGLITCPDESRWMENDGQFVIAHEIVHQWFGDSVSIKWWDSIWLNEGFASFLEYFIMNEFGFNDIWDKFINFKIPPALTFYDHGIISPSPNDIDFENMFDNLLYSKGACIVKMFYDIIGKDNFLNFCSKWLNQYKNKSVDISDFTSFVNKTLNKNYDDFFIPWFKNVGFPFLMVNEIVSDGKFVGININQILTKGVCYHCKLPIMYCKNGRTKVIDVMLDELSIKVDIDFDWVVVNHNIGSLCYVCYSEKLIQKLIELSFRSENLGSFDIYLINKSNEARQINQFRYRFG